MEKCKVCGDIFEEENIYQKTCSYYKNEDEEKHEQTYCLNCGKLISGCGTFCSIECRKEQENDNK